MHQAIKRINSVLEQLEEQAKIIDINNAKLSSHYLLQDEQIFSETLFSIQSDKLLAYVKETQKRTDELSRLLANNKQAYSQSRLELIEQQISAIINAINSNAGMHQEAQHRLDKYKAKRYKKMAKNVIQSSQSLYKKLAEHHEFERRLIEMLYDKEQLRNIAPPSKVDKCAADVLVIHQRLGRCRQAISKIEREIEAAEKGNLR